MFLVFALMMSDFLSLEMLRFIAVAFIRLKHDLGGLVVPNCNETSLLVDGEEKSLIFEVLSFVIFSGR